MAWCGRSEPLDRDRPIPPFSVKYRPGVVDDIGVKLQRCPYDGTPLEADAFSGGSYLLSCTGCGATWEAHNTLIRRTTEPDWDRAAEARARRVSSVPVELPSA